MKQLPVVASFLLFIALCVSIAYWGMQLFKPSTRPVAPPPAAAMQEVRLDAAAALFGGRPSSAVAVASNYELKGVVMSGTAGESIAILSADGKPAVATPVDKEILPGVTVKEVHPHYVVVSEHGISKRVELPDSAKNQSSMMMIPPSGAASSAGSEGGNEQQPAAAQGSAETPGAPGMSPMQGQAGAPPVLQSSPGVQQQASPNNGVINIPAPR